MNYSVAQVSFPYLTTGDDGESERNWAHMTFKAEPGGRIDRRRVKREIRKWVKRTLDRTLDSVTLRAIMQHVHWN